MSGLIAWRGSGFRLMSALCNELCVRIPLSVIRALKLRTTRFMFLDEFMVTQIHSSGACSAVFGLHGFPAAGWFWLFGQLSGDFSWRGFILGIGKISSTGSWDRTRMTPFLGSHCIRFTPLCSWVRLQHLASCADARSLANGFWGLSVSRATQHLLVLIVAGIWTRRVFIWVIWRGTWASNSRGDHRSNIADTPARSKPGGSRL